MLETFKVINYGVFVGRDYEKIQIKVIQANNKVKLEYLLAFTTQNYKFDTDFI